MTGTGSAIPLPRSSRVITLEEHFLTPSISHNPHNDFVAKMMGQRLMDDLIDLADGRIAKMDEAGIDVQVLSEVSPGAQGFSGKEALDLARESNDRLAAAVAANPTRLAGFATLPMDDPNLAAEELTRCIEGHGFVGALINTTFGPNGLFLDDPSYEPVLARAEGLGVPVYLHPSPAAGRVREMYYDGFDSGVTEMLSTASWGWHIETGLHILRLVLAGVFERHPDLQMIIGHCGEALPGMMARIDEFLTPKMTGLTMLPSDYFLRNVSVTTSAFKTEPPVRTAIQIFGIDRVMFSVDYPFGDNAACRTMLDTLPISPADKAKLAGGNAATLLGLEM